MRGGLSALVVFIGDLDRVGLTGPTHGRSQGVTVLQGMTMSSKAAPHYESAVRDMSQAAAEAELTHAPVRLEILDNEIRLMILESRPGERGYNQKSCTGG